MLVDPAGLAAAATRLSEALTGVSGDPVHPALGADPTSTGAAGRLSTAGAALATGLAAQLSALIATADWLGVVSAGYVATDEANARRLTLHGGGGSPSPLTDAAPPAPPLPPDVRAALPPVPGASGQAISEALHAGDPDAGQVFSASWSRVADAASEAAETVRSVIGRLPDVLDSPRAAPAVTAHLTGFVTGFDDAGRRADTLAGQADRHAALRTAAGQDIPTPQEFTEANARWQQVALANARSGGRYAVPLAQAEADLMALNTRAVSSYGAYAAGTDAATGTGDQPGEAEDPTGPHGAPGSGAADDPSGRGPDRDHGDGLPGSTEPGTAGADGLGSPEGMGQFASMIPMVLGAAGGLLGGLTKAPESLLQGGMQALQAATQGLSGLAKPDVKSVGDIGAGDPALGGGLGDTGGAGGGGGGEVTPMGGGPTPAPAGVTPSTGPPPTPPAIAAGGGLPPPVSPAGGAGGGMPMGMPMGGMGGGAGGKGEQPREKKVVVPPLPHTEAVTGMVNADRMATSATAATGRDGPSDDDPPGGPVVRRITMTRRDFEP